MTDPRILLERHKPRLVYDSQEAYFADSAAVFTDSPTNILKRANGAPIATPPKLSLDYLGRQTYGDGTKVLRDDVLGDSTRHYACLVYTSPSPRDGLLSRMPSSA